ncbi:hypothetical protein E4O04_09680 [Treponema sp. OMZ 799]|uniref:hypothetical protein n=1 Tax=Treponema sp. OMZ 799 TaxID=2563668 RepID=UPI0020A337C4|nr:hypothetical protein [Treponema sp. OMZ 799]UTC77074.1 hypothetical protein E4O04_03250 [Treponema sp. OMZ 799]UTC78259.1 hypothetical protein E4O04_09680 [Treponema sp. OMZ 799]
MKKVILLLLAVLLISTVFVGCDKNLASALASKAKHISLDPDIINVKVGETVEVKAKITDGNDQPVTVDNSKFEWSIVTGADAIDIVPNGNTVKITAKKTFIGNAMIKINHPEALSYIQRVVHITKEENSGTIPEEEKGDIFFVIVGDDTFEASPFWYSINNGDSLDLRVEIKKTKTSPSLEVDNSKFEWTIIEGKDFIKIEPNKNYIKITAIGRDGSTSPIIKVTHPYAKQEGRVEIGIAP